MQTQVLFEGKYLVGKSFTTNSLLNEEAAKRQFMNREASPPIAHTREAHGFTLSIIDTGGITEVDLLSTEVHSFIQLYSHLGVLIEPSYSEVITVRETISYLASIFIRASSSP